MSMLDRTALAALGAVLAYAVFEWGGVVRTGQYHYLLVLGLLAVVLSLARPRDEWAPLPGRVVRWTLALLPAYILMQVVPLPVALLRVLSPARAEAVAALDRIGAKVNFASLSVSPAATFQSFLLVCGYVIVFLLVRELTWRFDDSRWLAIWPIVAIGALEAGLGLCQNFGGGVDQVRWGTYVNHNHYAGFLEMALPFAVVYPVALWRRTRSRGHSAVAPALAACGVWALAGLMFAGIVLFLFTDGVHRDTFFPVRDGDAGTRNPPTELGGELPEAANRHGRPGRRAGAGRLRVSAAGQADRAIRPARFDR